MCHNFPIAFNQESKAASKEGTWKLSPRVFWTILWEIKFADVTLCTAKPRAEHWPQLILPGSQCCKKLLLVQQCMESPRHLRVGDMLCNLTLDSMQYSWSMIWEAQRSWTNCSPIWRPQSLQHHLALPRNTWGFRTRSAVQPQSRPSCWSSSRYPNLHGGCSSSHQTSVCLTSSPGKVC